MEITLTIVVTESENVGVKTHATDVPESQIRPMLEKAALALRAEIAALDNCPYHQARAHQA